MKIKETIYTEVDRNGRVIRQSRTVEKIDNLDTDYGYDYATRHGVFNDNYKASFDRIYEAYDDYRKSQQW